MRRQLLRTSAFVRAARRIVKKNPQVAESISKVLEKLEEDAFDSSLRTHKLKGPLEGRWACSAGYDLRILFRFVSYEDSEAILLLTVGGHDEVY
ncbi:MAG TPA: type II toxin-antitoxin system mRNA interferase toxin, RelE/StbE family [Thermoanaerobaculia bacterium]|nr:type II toxin-antitoxin system mRNA interferase toxin, RelE/StbE family [Thermoanaerobaculia bacterium]